MAASVPRTAHLAARWADGVNFTWHYAERIPSLFDALDAGLKEGGRDRRGFDRSLHVRWNNLGPKPTRQLEEWEAVGFTRVIVSLSQGFPLDEIKSLASLTLGDPGR